jgi:hypothetical protein
MQYRLRGELAALGRDPDELRFHLFSADARDPADAQRRGAPRLRSRARRARVASIAAPKSSTSPPGACGPRNGETLAADEIVWVTQAGGAPGCATPAWRSMTPGFHPRPRHAAERERPADLRRRRLRAR